ncbi:heat-inducible transcriptional repressor HrcA [bacterium]|nr:heat-inducible transcriptional repressor HrcA [bacterium]MBU1919428.1 heat-inducible transcriptional repressor HrcA [bacterium]
MNKIPSLSNRERDILRAVVHHFILTANPVGSRQLAKKYGINLSPATVRNVMADLEEMGLLSQPHTSAGRIPSDLGYRVYVNDLMETCELSSLEQEEIERQFDGVSHELDEILATTSRVLSSASSLLSVVVTPSLDNAVLERVELARLSDNRLLVVITLQSGPTRTIMVELEQSVSEDHLQQLAYILNQRLAGLKLSQIREQISDRMHNMPSTPAGLIRFFVESAEKLFTFPDSSDLVIDGRSKVIEQPEFSDPRSMRGIIELVEDKNIIVHLLSKQAQRPVTISIGSENIDQRAKSLSVLAIDYQTATMSGKLGVIGPTRMDYSKMKTLLEFTAKTVTRHLK